MGEANTEGVAEDRHTDVERRQRSGREAKKKASVVQRQTRRALEQRGRGRGRQRRGAEISG